MYCGIGTHFVPSASIEDLRRALSTENISSWKCVEDILNRFSHKVPGTKISRTSFTSVPISEWCFFFGRKKHTRRDPRKN